MSFSIDDFGAEPVEVENHPCAGCPRCAKCHQQFRYMCEAHHHIHANLGHQVFFNDNAKHSCGCNNCVWYVRYEAVSVTRLRDG